MLVESGSEKDYVFAESENSSSSERECESDLEERAVQNLESIRNCDTSPTPKRTKEWIVSGDRPSKFHFTGNPGIKPAIIRNLPPEPNPLEVFQLMVHDSLWDEITTETNRFTDNFMTKIQIPLQ